MKDWASLAAEYNHLLRTPNASDAISRLIGDAASEFPRNSDSALQWFAFGLADANVKFFVAAVLAKVNPVPTGLSRALAAAAIAEPNPSSVRVFVEPLVRSIGAEEATAKLRSIARMSSAPAHRLQQAIYWVPGAGV
jgi:hypothetical protein